MYVLQYGYEYEWKYNPLHILHSTTQREIMMVFWEILLKSLSQSICWIHICIIVDKDKRNQ